MQFWAYHIIGYMSERSDGVLEHATSAHLVLDKPDEAEALRQAREILLPGRNYYITRAVVERWPDLEQAGFNPATPLQGLISALRAGGAAIQADELPAVLQDAPPARHGLWPVALVGAGSED